MMKRTLWAAAAVAVVACVPSPELIPAWTSGGTGGADGAGGDGATSTATSGGTGGVGGAGGTGGAGGGGGCEGEMCGVPTKPRPISAGDEHTCAVAAGGGVKCWGLNDKGQLGDSTAVDSPVPVDATGLSSGVVSVAAGGFHSCALTSAGAVKCWGLNDRGQLGNDSTTDSPVPVDVTGLSSGVVAIAAGTYHTCALSSAGALKCWGLNDKGLLGDGSTTNRDTPADVTDLSSGVIAVAAGAFHTCAVTSVGAVKCWGYNVFGQLGDGSTNPSPVPVDITDLLSGVIAISAGSGHTCAVTSAGAVKCWGDSFYFQLGEAVLDQSAVPVDVTGLSSGVADIGAGGVHTCALTTGGAVKCWGANGDGQLGNDSTGQSKLPVDVVGLSSGVDAVSGGKLHTCARTGAGGFRCWGANAHGQLGDSSTTARDVPVDVVGIL